jgi:SAM-dependent methyltransferase
MEIKERLIRPWSHPSGIAGHLAGWEMAAGKTPLNNLIVELLSLDGWEDVLEIGFGPGTTLARVTEATSGRVAGVDPSPTMLAQAAKRNAEAARAGRADLRLASAERLPFGDTEFDRVVAAHTVGHWESAPDAFAEIARVLRAGGQLLLIVRAGADGLVNDLLDAGLIDVKVSARRIGRKELTVVQARRPAP